MNLTAITEQIYRQEPLCKDQLLALLEVPLADLLPLTQEITASWAPKPFELCTIINGRSGHCSEDCTFCAQYGHYPTAIAHYDLLDEVDILASAQANYANGVHRFSIVTSGRTLSSQDSEKLAGIYSTLHRNSPISLCASHGLLSLEQLQSLKANGVTRYHNNLETSANYFPTICTTHTYADKLQTLANAKKAGLSLCSGGIIGLGETMEDRLDLALTLQTLGVDSVPINIFTPIPGTPLAKNVPLSLAEICQTIALFRLALPQTTLRLAGGRRQLPQQGLEMIPAGINAWISGSMLTTDGVSTGTDIVLLQQLGLEVGHQ